MAEAPGSADVGRTRRRYDNTRRSEQARETRAAVHRAAFRLFGEQGYASTTLAQVAAAAGVSHETVRKMGPKSRLLDGAREVGVFDQVEVDGIMATDVMRSVAAAADLADAVDLLVDFYATSNRRVAAFLRTWQAAALDDEVVAQAWRREVSSAHDAFRTGVTFAADRGWLRDDVGPDELALTLWVLVSSETWTRLVEEGGVSDAGYRSWLRRMLLEGLGRGPARGR